MLKLKRSLQICVVEENESEAAAVSEALRGDGFRNVIVLDGVRELLEFLGKEEPKPDVVLLCAELLLRGGAGLLETMSSNPVLPKTAIVFTSKSYYHGNAAREYYWAAIPADFSSRMPENALLKPFSIAALTIVLRSIPRFFENSGQNS